MCRKILKQKLPVKRKKRNDLEEIIQANLRNDVGPKKKQKKRKINLDGFIYYINLSTHLMESRYIATVTYAFKENDMEKNSTAVYFANFI